MAMTKQDPKQPPTMEDGPGPATLSSLSPDQTTLFFWNCHANYTRGSARGKVIGFILGTAFAFSSLAFFNWLNS